MAEAARRQPVFYGLPFHSIDWTPITLTLTTPVSTAVESLINLRVGYCFAMLQLICLLPWLNVSCGLFQNVLEVQAPLSDVHGLWPTPDLLHRCTAFALRKRQDGMSQELKLQFYGVSGQFGVHQDSTGEQHDGIFPDLISKLGCG